MVDEDQQQKASLANVDYDEWLFAVYDRGQSMPSSAISDWVRRFSVHIDSDVGEPLTIVDLGSGTGRFSLAMAKARLGRIIGVEPSREMRAAAIRFRSHEAIVYVAGRAEYIPVKDSACDAVLLFRVLQHISNPARAAMEISRVLRTRGRSLIMGEWAGRPYPRPWAKYFPRANAIAETCLPTIEDTIEVFSQVGMRFVAVDRAQEEIATSLQDYLERLRHRAITAMSFLSESEIETGLTAAKAEIAVGNHSGPVWYESEMVVMEKI